MDDQSKTVCGGPDTVISSEAAEADMANALVVIAKMANRSVRSKMARTGTASHLRQLRTIEIYS
jgi:hypothetical protein